MKVFLVIPSYDFQEFFPGYMAKSQLSSDKNLVPGAVYPLGLLYISSSLQQQGIKTEVIDGFFCSFEEIINRLSKAEPDLVGIQATTPLWRKVKKLSRAIKSSVGSKVVVGGPHISLGGVKVIKGEEAIDFAVAGEAETVLTRLCGEIEQDRDVFETPGVAWKGDEGLVRNEPLPYFLDDLDSIPLPDRNAVGLKDYRPSIGFYRDLPSATLITSRGCKYSCKFCHARKTPLRERSVDDVIQEMREMDKQGIKDIIVYDQDFGANKNRAFEICSGIIDEGFDFYLGGNLRIDSFDPELVRKMKQAGFWRIFYGIESAVRKNLNEINKGIKLEESKQAVIKTDNIGIQVFGSFILGIPGETYQEELETVELAKELPLTFAKFLPFSPWPGTEVWENPDKFGKLDKSPEKLAMNKVNFVPHTMKEEELHKLLKKAYKSFYLRPEYMLKRLTQLRTKEDIFQNLKGLSAFLRA